MLEMQIMNKETLEKANELQNEIHNLDNAIRYLDSNYEIALCWYFVSNYGNSEYKKIITLTQDEINECEEKIKKKLEQLEKEFEELWINIKKL